MTEKTEKSCGAVLYCRQGNEIMYLLIRQHGRDFFGFPKGHVEGEETERQTALREVQEEVGLAVSLHPSWRRQIEYPLPQKPGITKIVVFFLAQFAPSSVIRIQPSEVAEYRLVPYQQAVGLLRPNTVAVLQAAHTQIQ